MGRVEAILRALFTRWGQVCAAHPYLVILFAFMLSGGLAIGNLKFTVVTDPVQLWSSPSSTARQQMDTFADSFGPFYRTTQIILRAPQVEGETYLAFDDSGLSTTSVYFSGMFNRDVLLQLYDLQEQILGLTAQYANETVTIADICLRPLCNDTDTTRDPTCSSLNCTIFSPLNWFQNDRLAILKVLLNIFVPLHFDDS